MTVKTTLIESLVALAFQFLREHQSERADLSLAFLAWGCNRGETKYKPVDKFHKPRTDFNSVTFLCCFSPQMESVGLF